MHRLQKAVYGVIAALALVLVDRLLKAAALDGLSFSLGPWVEFDLFRNAGIAFSLPLSGPLVWILSLAIIGLSFTLLIRDLRASKTDRVPALLLFAVGASSNLFDRMLYGYTVDYLIFFGRSAVNLADGMILAGALWLMVKKPFSPPLEARGGRGSYSGRGDSARNYPS